jgi:hypothetical protein
MADSKPSPQPQPAAAGMPMWMKIVVFYGRFAPSFTAVGYVARGLPLRPLRASFKGQTWLVTGATGGIGKGIALGAASAARPCWPSVATKRRDGAGAGARARAAAVRPELVAANLALADGCCGEAASSRLSTISAADHAHSPGRVRACTR